MRRLPPRQAAAFEGSKHRHAMAPASPASVRADFADTRFDGPRQATRFTRQLARFMVRTEGADGRPADFEVSHTFGIHPLQQYLIPQPGGRLQALGVAWDTTRQRWFHCSPTTRRRPARRSTGPAATRTGT
jgi:hypothetical protein